MLKGMFFIFNITDNLINFKQRFSAVLLCTRSTYHNMKQYKLSILLTPEDEGGYSVTVPELPGCFTQGETIEEALDMAKEAICLYVESLEANGAPMPI
jgi:antitoxin HicB